MKQLLIGLALVGGAAYLGRGRPAASSYDEAVTRARKRLAQRQLHALVAR